MPPYIHKRFNRLGLYVSHAAKNNLPFRQMLATPLMAAYSAHLKGPSFDGIRNINIYLTNLAAEDDKVSKKVVGFLDYYLLFDFQEFAHLKTDQERQYYLLAHMQQAVSQVTQQEGWELTRFEQAYQACISKELPVAIR